MTSKGLCQLLALGLLTLNPPKASAFEAVLVDDARPTKIKIAPLPDAQDRFLVVWEKLDTDPKQGVLVFSREAESTETRFMPVGGVGPLAIVDHHASVLMNGSQVPTVELVLDDPMHPRKMKVSKEAVDSAAILEQYRKSEELGGPSDTKASIQSAIDADLRSYRTSCGGNASVQINWASFEKTNQLAVSKQSGAAIKSMSEKCVDSAYKEALGKITSFVISYNDGAKDLSFKKTGNSIEIRLHQMGFNPKERALQWILKEL